MNIATFNNITINSNNNKDAKNKGMLFDASSLKNMLIGSNNNTKHKNKNNSN
jgi:hypothetical protein